jgi:hypothetical protein
MSRAPLRCIHNVVGEENSVEGVAKCGTHGTASQYGKAYE